MTCWQLDVTSERFCLVQVCRDNSIQEDAMHCLVNPPVMSYPYHINIDEDPNWRRLPLKSMGTSRREVALKLYRNLF